jgi:hypothetical protein
MAVQTPTPAPADSRPADVPGADVIKDAQARQRRHRQTGAMLLLIAAGGAAGALVTAGGGGGGQSHSPGQAGGSPLWRSVVVRLARGRSTGRFVIHAPAGHAYRVSLSAPDHFRVRLTMRINDFSGWSIELSRNPGCTTTPAGSRCTSNFAAGGNPGGVWTGTLQKTTGPAETARVTIAFAPHRGDFHG